MADRFVFANFAITTLVEAIGPIDTTLLINADDFTRFPSLVQGGKFPLILAEDDDEVEIVYVTVLTSGGVATVERGQEGTQARSWLAGTVARHGFTAATVRSAAGFNPRGAYSASLQYNPGDVVESAGISYINQAASIGQTPIAGSPYWMQVFSPPGAAATALNWQNRWSPSVTYAVGQVVSWLGRIWQSNVNLNLNSTPAVNNPNWTHIARWSGSAWYEPVLDLSGTNNYSVTLTETEGPADLYDGMTIKVRVASPNTSNATLAITRGTTAFGAKPLRRRAGVELANGELRAGELYRFTYLAGSQEFISDRLSPSDTPIIREYKTSTTWSKPAGLRFVVVELWGGGGAGNSSIVAPGGCGGGYAKKKILASALGATETVTVGAGGVLNSDGTGGTGGTTSFGAHVQASGGGQGGSASVGSGFNGDQNLSGQLGGIGVAGAHVGAGGNAPFMSGAAPAAAVQTFAMTNSGGGGSSGGGLGAAGYCVVTEYY